MGYRSDVAYCIRFECDDNTRRDHTFYTFLAEAKAKPETALCFTADGRWQVEVDEAKRRLTFSAINVKWYEDTFEEVKCHMALLELARDYEKDKMFHAGESAISCKFARIGEEVEDIEEWSTEGYCYDEPYVTRQIITNWD